MNEHSKDLVSKWNNFLLDLKLTNTQKLNYSRLLENIALYNRQDAKFVLSLGFRTLKEIPELHIVARKKNPEKIHIVDIEDESLYDAGVIVIDYAMSLIEKIIQAIKTKIPSDFKISNIEIERSANILSINLVL